MDPTPPVVVTKPHFLSPRDGSPAVGQWDRSVLRVAWDFIDPESSVVSHTVSIRSKLTGRLVVDPVMLGADTEVNTPDLLTRLMFSLKRAYPVLVLGFQCFSTDHVLAY